MDDRVTTAVTSTPQMAAAVDDSALVRHMLAVEAALARASAAHGLVPVGAAEAIAAACTSVQPDPEELRRGVIASATPVIALVAAIRAALPPDIATHVHRGATTQDVVDSAVVLSLRDALGLLEGALAEAAGAAASLAARHRDTVVAGRTLLQQASPTTFGLKAAGWAVELHDAGGRIGAVRDDRLTAQLGGAVGTLAALGPEALAIADAFADLLGVRRSPVPWHTRRDVVVDVAAAVATGAAACEKVGLDVILLAQTEVGEVRERPIDGGGGSSTLPNKHNPAGSVGVRVAARRALDGAAALVAHPPHEHERAAGAWQLEWATLQDVLLAAHAAAIRAAAVLDGLDVDVERMAANVRASGGATMAEALGAVLGDVIGWGPAQDVVREAVARAGASGRPLRDELLADDAVRGAVAATVIDDALDPQRYLGMAGALVDRALAAVAPDLSGRTS